MSGEFTKRNITGQELKSRQTRLHRVSCQLEAENLAQLQNRYSFIFCWACTWVSDWTHVSKRNQIVYIVSQTIVNFCSSNFQLGLRPCTDDEVFPLLSSFVLRLSVMKPKIKTEASSWGYFQLIRPLWNRKKSSPVSIKFQVPFLVGFDSMCSSPFRFASPDFKEGFSPASSAFSCLCNHKRTVR